MALRETKYKNELELEQARIELEQAQLALERERMEKPGGISQEAIDEIVRRAKLM